MFRHKSHAQNAEEEESAKDIQSTEMQDNCYVRASRSRTNRFFQAHAQELFLNRKPQRLFLAITCRKIRSYLRSPTRSIPWFQSAESGFFCVFQPGMGNFIYSLRTLYYEGQSQGSFSGL